jgi:hypothetical protein
MQRHSCLFGRLWPRLALSVSGLLVAGQAWVGAADLPAIIYPNYHNTLQIGTANPDVANASSAALFTGTLGAYSAPGSGLAPTVPAGGTNQLVESAFGQTFAENIPYPGFEDDAIRLAQAVVYPSANLVGKDAIAASGAAFRYKELQYEKLADGQLRLNYESVTSLFGTAERTQIQQAIATLREALKYAPFHRGLRHALLDVYYDWIVAEQQIAKELRADTARIRLGLIAVDPSRLVIDYELGNQTNVLNQYEAIWTHYSSLLHERAGVDLRRFDPSLPIHLPLGSYLFREEQPFRNQLAASFWDGDIKRTFDTNGVAVSGSPTVLFQGYKDYVALLSLLRDYVDVAAETARLYAMRGRTAGGVNDPESAAALLSRVQTEAFVDLATLDYLLPTARAIATYSSGQHAAWNGIMTSMRELEGVAAFLRGDRNSLGFDPNMLVLFQSPQGVIGAEDSYDALMQWINPDQTGTTILGFARNRFDAAKAAYEQYRGYKDQLADQMSQIEETYTSRYQQITGYTPGEAPDPWPPELPVYPPVRPGAAPDHFVNPRSGSELSKAHREVALADQKRAKLDELDATNQVQLAEVFVSLEEANQYTDQIMEATAIYKNKIRKERDTMTRWNAAQAGVSAYNDLVNNVWNQVNSSASGPFNWIPGVVQVGIGVSGPLLPSPIIPTPGPLPVAPLPAGIPGLGLPFTVLGAGLANVAIQTAGEVEKGKAEKKLDMAAADFQFALANAGVNEGALAASAEIRKLNRETISRAMERDQVQGQRKDAVGREAALMRELANLPTRALESTSDLAGRYFADPIFYLRSQNLLIEADYAFREAQRWVFFGLRALEYKYNAPFLWDDGLRDWDVSSLYALRNFTELEGMLTAMGAFNLANNQKRAQGRLNYTDSISLRRDVWGLSDSATDLAKFKSQLQGTLNSIRGIYELNLNPLVLAQQLSFRQDQGSFFTSPDYNLQGEVISAGRYLDKIEWLKFHVLDRSQSSTVTRQAGFSYGGVAYERTFCSRNRNDEGETPGELTSFPFRYFVPGGNSSRDWTSFPEHRATVNLVFSAQEGEPTSPGFTSWRERGVATTQWTLEIPAANLINPDQVEDLVIYINHNATPRQNCN